MVFRTGQWQFEDLLSGTKQSVDSFIKLSKIGAI